MHEYSIKLEAPVTPGNLPVMGVDALIALSGHPMHYFNGSYWPRQIVESFDPKSGWHWVVDALNHPLAQGAV